MKRRYEFLLNRLEGRSDILFELAYAVENDNQCHGCGWASDLAACLRERAERAKREEDAPRRAEKVASQIQGERRRRAAAAESMEQQSRARGAIIETEASE